MPDRKKIYILYKHNPDCDDGLCALFSTKEKADSKFETLLDESLDTGEWLG